MNQKTNNQTTLAPNSNIFGGDLIDLSDIDWSSVKDVNSLENQMCLKEKVLMVLEALHNVLLRNSSNLRIKFFLIFILDIEIILIGHFQLIFDFLLDYDLPDIQEKTLNIIWVSLRNRECINDIACSIKLPILFVLLVKLPNGIIYNLNNFFLNNYIKIYKCFCIIEFNFH